MRRYLDRPRKRHALTCTRCLGRFADLAAYDRHIVTYDGPDGDHDKSRKHDWCHLPEEVGLANGPGGWWRTIPNTPQAEIAA